MPYRRTFGGVCMITVERPAELRERLGAAGDARVGFVPTMGYLHAGHLALVERARAVADLVVASIFVNPTQFAPTEDLAVYPRDPDGDAAKLAAAGCDVLFAPGVVDVYPAGFSSSVFVEGITSRYEGAFRPDHFRGVATVVAKLFNMVHPHVAVFGQKDAQQVAVVRRMIADLNFPIELEVVPTVREPDGLAMSSRNVYLSASDRREALSIWRGLCAARDAVARGASPRDAELALRAELSSQFAIDYADVINAHTFQPAEHSAEPLLAVFAGRIGSTRLIDNLPLGADAPAPGP